MQKILYYFKRVSLAAQFLLLAVTAVQLISQYRSHAAALAAFLVADALLIFFDLYRVLTRSEQKHYFILTGLSLILCIGLLFFCRDTAFQIYYFFLLDFIFNMRSSNVKKIFIATHLMGFLLSQANYSFFIEQRSLWTGITSLLITMTFYGLLLFVFAIIHYFKSEQVRLQVLNADLLTYSFEEREYLINRERSQISQELHDSIGHSLMAVMMNVRFLNAITPKENEKQIGQINEIEALLKECVASLRQSVSSLRELEENIQLKEEIERVVQKFNELGFVRIELSFDDKIDRAGKQIKSVIYKTIREGITNSIRHGNASKIVISLHCSDDEIELVIMDNGTGCADIHKSVGLNGILERVSTVDGKAYFMSEKNKGFTIRIVLPGRFEV